MTETRIIDTAWAKPAAAAIKAAGYSGVMGYISHDPSKDMSPTQAKAYIAAGLRVGLVFESTAARASEGRAAGIEDRKFAEAQARQRGYPTECPIFYAVDFDAHPDAVMPYFAGIAANATYPVGVYGGVRVVDGVMGSKRAKVAWQTEAWSGGAVSPHASLLQRVKATGKPIAGVKPGDYDENVVLQPLTLWGGVVAPPGSKPKPANRTRPFLPTTRAAIRLLTRRLRSRKQPLTPHGRALLVALQAQIRRVLAIK